MPAWWTNKEKRQEVWENCKVEYFCDGGNTSSYTYLHKDKYQKKMPKTDDLLPIPACVEIMANGAHWDPYGIRWGRGCH